MSLEEPEIILNYARKQFSICNDKDLVYAIPFTSCSWFVIIITQEQHAASFLFQNYAKVVSMFSTFNIFNTGKVKFFSV